ncbi:MAG: Uncharacterized protein G01um10148_960 [Parcubacteria group bacterium Gr01-1014_8]|nr:MAG: Uncharacterized protein G01um10148_960 [Parcubacteria group bacterium Gr01-1014_8]
MSTWLGLAVFAQFLFAVSVLVDKHIVLHKEHIGKPVVYAFYVSLLSGFVIVLAPFGFVSLPSLLVLAYSLVSAITFLVAIYFLYSALSIAFASDVAPVVGAVSAISTLVLAAIWIDGDVTGFLVLPVALLISGTALISHFHFTRRALLFVVSSGAMFGVTVFLSKLIFIETNFIDGVFWTRMMNVVVALFLLLIPSIQLAIFTGGRHSSHGAKFLVIGNKIVAGSASVLTAFAVSLGSVSVVNSLAGLQFVFLFALTYLLSKSMPGPSKNTSHIHVGFLHTAIGVVLIVLGLALLYAGHINA